MQLLLCPCPGERDQEVSDLLTSHSSQAPLRVYPALHYLLPTSNWSFPGAFGERMSPFYKEGHQVPEKEAFLFLSQVNRGVEPSVGTSSPVFFL